MPIPYQRTCHTNSTTSCDPAWSSKPTAVRPAGVCPITRTYIRQVLRQGLFHPPRISTQGPRLLPACLCCGSQAWSRKPSAGHYSNLPAGGALVRHVSTPLPLTPQAMMASIHGDQGQVAKILHWASCSPSVCHRTTIWALQLSIMPVVVLIDALMAHTLPRTFHQPPVHGTPMRYPQSTTAV